MRQINVKTALAAAHAGSFQDDGGGGEGWEAVLDVPLLSAKTDEISEIMVIDGQQQSEVSLSHEQRDDEVQCDDTRDERSDTEERRADDNDEAEEDVEDVDSSLRKQLITSELDSVEVSTTPKMPPVGAVLSEESFLADLLTESEKSDDEEISKATTTTTESECEEIAPVHEGEKLTKLEVGTKQQTIIAFYQTKSDIERKQHQEQRDAATKTETLTHDDDDKSAELAEESIGSSVTKSIFTFFETRTMNGADEAVEVSPTNEVTALEVVAEATNSEETGSSTSTSDIIKEEWQQEEPSATTLEDESNQIDLSLENEQDVVGQSRFQFYETTEQEKERLEVEKIVEDTRIEVEMVFEEAFLAEERRIAEEEATVAAAAAEEEAKLKEKQEAIAAAAAAEEAKLKAEAELKAVLERQRRRIEEEEAELQRRRIEEEEELKAVLERQRKRIEEQRLTAEEEPNLKYVVHIQKCGRRYNARRQLSQLREHQAATEQATEEERTNMIVLTDDVYDSDDEIVDDKLLIYAWTKGSTSVEQGKERVKDASGQESDIDAEEKARVANEYKTIVEKAAEEARTMELKHLANIRHAETHNVNERSLVEETPVDVGPITAEVTDKSEEEEDTFAVDTQTDWDVEAKLESVEGIEVDANEFSVVAIEKDAEVDVEADEVEPGEIPMPSTARKEVDDDEMAVEAADDISVANCKNAVLEAPIIEDRTICPDASDANPLLDPIFLDEFALSQSPETVPASQDSYHDGDERPESVDSAPSDEIVETNDSVELEPTKTTKDVIELIKNHHWMELSQMMESHPRLASISLSHGSSLLSSGRQGNLVLHEVCKNDPPVDVVDSVVKAHDVALKTRGQWGYLPLHYACVSAASAEVIKFLISSYPDAVKEVDGNEKMLPLHLACKWGISQDSISALFEAHPAASSVLDSYSKIPMDYAISLSPGPVRAATIDCLLKSSAEEGENSKDCSSELREEFDSPVTNVQNDNKESQRHEVLIEEKTIEGLAHAQAEKKALLDADRKVVQDLQAAQAEKTALLESEKSKNRDIETTVAEREALLETEKVNVMELESTVSRKQTLLETEQETVKALERAISQRDALLDLEQMKIKRLEVVQSEKRVLLESEHEMVQAIAKKHAQKVALLESEEAVVVELESKKKAAEALIESEETTVRELERRQAEKAALLEAEQQLVKALERTKAEKQALLEAEQKTQREIRNSKIERRRLSVAVETFLNLTRSQKNILLQMAQQRAHFILRVTRDAARFFYKPLSFSRDKRLLRGPNGANYAIASTSPRTVSTEEQKPPTTGGKRIVSKLLVYCNGLIGLNKPRTQSKENGDE